MVLSLCKLERVKPHRSIHGMLDTCDVHVIRVVAAGYKKVSSRGRHPQARVFAFQRHLRVRPGRKGCEGSPSDQRKRVRVDTKL